MANQAYIVVHQPISSSWIGPSAFKLDGGELIETVEFYLNDDDNFVPNWIEGGPCDLARGMNPELQTHIKAALLSLQGGN